MLLLLLLLADLLYEVEGLVAEVLVVVVAVEKVDGQIDVGVRGGVRGRLGWLNGWACVTAAAASPAVWASSIGGVMVALDDLGLI